MRETLIYLTGFMEADGWVTCYRTTNGYYMNLGLEGSEYSIVELLQKTFGGRITIRKQRGSVSTKALYRWNCYGKDGAKAIELMTPFFRTEYKAWRFKVSYIFWTHPDKRDRALEALRARTETERTKGASLPSDSPSCRENEPAEANGNDSLLRKESNND